MYVINSIRNNRFCFNRMKYKLYLELELELSLAKSFFPFFHLELYEGRGQNSWDYRGSSVS
jgi:hypothetical protein